MVLNIPALKNNDRGAFFTDIEGWCMPPKASR